MFLFDSNEIVRRLRKYPILEHFSEPELRELVAQSETLALETDEILFRHDDASDSVFYLIEGRLEGFTLDDFLQKILDVHRGEMIGEMGVISDEPRSLSVKASVSSYLLKINKDVFLDFFKKKPELLILLTQTIAKRLRHVIMDLRNTHYLYKNIGLVFLSNTTSIEEMKAVFKKYIDVDCVSLYEKKDYETTHMDSVSFFYHCEENIGVNIFIVDYQNDSWSQAVLNHIEYVYVVLQEGEWDKLTIETIGHLRNRPADIVIMHRKPLPYENTSRFYDKYPFKRHHHIRADKPSYQRLYRYMTGQAIGVVFSGGGLRGYIHYGLVKALLEAKVPIDCIGGASMGAALGGFFAMQPTWRFFDDGFNAMKKLFKQEYAFRHLTLPMVSVLNGEVVTELLQQCFSSYLIEDMPMNFFCVVGNLSKIQKEIKTQGVLWEWIRASVSIPGVFPPLVKDGQIYVDGAVCANLPVQDMRNYLDNAGKVIAFNVHSHPFGQKDYNFPPVLTFKELIKWRLGLSKEKYVFPNLVDILTESTFINQYMKNSQEMARADILFSPDTSTFNLYEAMRGEKLHMFAYELAQEKLKESKSLYERWID